MEVSKSTCSPLLPRRERSDDETMHLKALVMEDGAEARRFDALETFEPHRFFGGAIFFPLARVVGSSDWRRYPPLTRASLATELMIRNLQDGW